MARSATTASRPTCSPGWRGPELSSTLAARVACALGLAVLGVLVGGAAVLTHGRTPGLVLGLVASVAVAWALPGGWWTRFAFTTGWVVALGYALLPRGSGGYLVGSDLRGYLLLGTGLVLMLVGIATLRPLRARPDETTPAAEGRSPRLAP